MNMISKQEAVKLSAELWSLHKEMNILPPTVTGGSIFWELMIGCMEGRNVSIKELNAMVSAAPSVVRRAIRQMEFEGWLIAQTDVDDFRVRRIIPSEKFLYVADEIAVQCASKLMSRFGGHIA
jgi:hypothetical protein